MVIGVTHLKQQKNKRANLRRYNVLSPMRRQHEIGIYNGANYTACFYCFKYV